MYDLNQLMDSYGTLATLFVVQGICGILLFELAWFKCGRAIHGEEELYRNVPLFRRIDCHLWSRAKFYPGAFLMLIPRALWVANCFFMLLIGLVIAYIGKDVTKPLKHGYRF